VEKSKCLDRWNFKENKLLFRRSVEFVSIHIDWCLVNRLVIVIDISIVEQVEELAVYLSLYGCLWGFGIE